MELEAKHLAPYLPYGLKLQYTVRDKVEQTGIMKSISHNKNETHPTRVSIEFNNEEHIWMFKPVLVPLKELSAYSNGIKHRGYRTDENNFLNLISDIESGRGNYDIMQMCFEEHIDVFGLIKAGLAIDINTL
jgi:hypothetical protein